MGKGLIITAMVVILVVSFLLFVNGDGSTISSSSIDENINLRECILSIEGMYCEACGYGVKAQIEELNGVMSADINYKDSSGVVLYDANKVDAETIAAASTVYPASVVSDNPK